MNTAEKSLARIPSARQREALAHGIRNPLSSLRLQLENCRNQTDTLNPLHQSLSSCLEEVDRIGNTVESFIDYGLGTLGVSKRTFDISTMLEEVKSQNEGTAGRRGISIEIHTAAEIEARTDRSLLKKALQRILHNAIGASSFGQTIVMTSQIETTGISISIQDQGSGMDEAMICRLGEPFFIENSKGLGLGLHLAMRDLHRLGARISFESEVGAGTKVQILLKESEEQK